MLASLSITLSLQTLWMVVYLLIISSIIILILLENRNPIKAMAWTTVLVLLPVVGLIVYLFFGQNHRRTKLISRGAYKRIMSNALPEIPTHSTHSRDYIHKYKTLTELVLKATGSPILDAYEVQAYSRGKEKFEVLKQDLLSAKSHIHLEYYRFLDDDIGAQIAEILIAKATEGVDVRVIYDHVGSLEARRSFFRKMQQKGVQVFPFVPIIFPWLSSKVNHRNHRKIVVIDGTIGYIGGMNIADKYIVGDRLGTWQDSHIRLVGPAVNGLQACFITDWYVASRRILPRQVYYDFCNGASTDFGINRSIPIQIVQSGPIGPWRTLQQVLCNALYNARERVWIETPYFLPNEPLNKAIIGAALSGIDVRLIVPDKSDTRFVRFGADSYLEELLEARVKVYRYRAGFLHSKLLLVDQDLSIIGSPNIDFRSLEHNFEISACIYDTAFNEYLESVFEQDFLHCIKVSPKKWHKRPLWRKIVESLMRLFAPIM